MGELLKIQNYMQEEENLEKLDTAALQDRLSWLREQIAALDAREPENMDSEAYEEWADDHEDLEDLVDEILDILDTRK